MIYPNGQLKVWWIPQVPMKAFEVLVASIEEGAKIIEVLALYDLFQLENNIKPDYANTGGLVIWDEQLEPDEKGEKWTDWFYEEEDFYTENIEEYLQYKQGEQK